MCITVIDVYPFFQLTVIDDGVFITVRDASFFVLFLPEYFLLSLLLFFSLTCSPLFIFPFGVAGGVGLLQILHARLHVNKHLS